MALALRSLRPTDRDAIREILLGNQPVFSDREVGTCLEMVDEALSPHPDDPDPYHYLLIEDDSRLAGFACYGTVPLTQGTYDLYWIAVDRSRHRSGVGRVLLDGVEAAIRGRGGHLVVVETSSRADYDATRAFYERRGYERAAWIKDFYRKGDDKVMYVKHL